MNKIKIEYIYLEGCPNHEILHNNFSDVVNNLEDMVDIKYINVDNDETARSIGFRGSPTLLINSEDIEGMPPQYQPSLCYRFYICGVLI